MRQRRLRRGAGLCSVVLLLSGAVACSEGPPDPEQAGTEPGGTEFAELEGATLAYEVTGPATGETVLLIAGTGMQLIEWPAGLIDGLVDEGFQVVRFDNRDVGLTTMPGEFEPIDEEAVGAALAAGEPAPIPYTFDDLAGDALGLLDEIDVSQAHLVGLSMGGAIAQLVALDAPERVASLTLLAADSGNPDLPDTADPDAFAGLPPQPETDDLDAVIDYRVAMAQALAGEGYPTDAATLRAQEEAAVDRSYNPEALARQAGVSLIGHIETAEYRFSQWENIAAPTMVVHGDDDPLVPVAAARDLDTRIPDSELRVLPGLGHDLPEPLTEEFVDAIRTVAQRA